MGKAHNRWILINHEKCNSFFTINGEKFLSSFENSRRPIYCPTCSEAVTNGGTRLLKEFLETYSRLTQTLALEGFSLREIEGGIERQTSSL